MRTQMGRQGYEDVTYVENTRAVVVEEKTPWTCVCYLYTHLGWSEEKVRESFFRFLQGTLSVPLLLGCWCGPHCLISRIVHKFLMLFLSFSEAQTLTSLPGILSSEQLNCSIIGPRWRTPGAGEPRRDSRNHCGVNWETHSKRGEELRLSANITLV